MAKQVPESEHTDATPVPDAENQRRLRNSSMLARLMDDLVRIPGTKIGLGLDSLIGLVPGVGDAAGAALSGMILVEGVRSRVPVHVLLRMALNLLADMVIGYIPFAGDIADVGFRANKMNARLLEESITEGKLVHVSDRAYLARAVGVVVAILAVLVASAVFTIWLLIKLVQSF